MKSGKIMMFLAKAVVILTTSLAANRATAQVITNSNGSSIALPKLTVMIKYVHFRDIDTKEPVRFLYFQYEKNNTRITISRTDSLGFGPLFMAKQNFYSKGQLRLLKQEDNPTKYELVTDDIKFRSKYDVVDTTVVFLRKLKSRDEGF